MFTRTFLLLATLMLACLAAWAEVFVILEMEPRAIQNSKRITTAVNLTRSALAHATRTDIPTLLDELSLNESLDVIARSPTDIVEPIPDDRYWQKIAHMLKQHLGSDTIVAWTVNNRHDFWISFSIDEKQYWLAMHRDDLELSGDFEWIGWAVAAIVFSLIGALISVRYINRPLSRLVHHTQQISTGQSPPPLPETGPREIRQLNTSFNRMTEDWRQTENDRELMIAGISHDLRTPLTRMRLEIELSQMPEASIQAIDQDLRQIDHTIDQLLEYSRAAKIQERPSTDISTALESLLSRERLHTGLIHHELTSRIQPNIHVRIDPVSFARIVLNLIDNAYRYGGDDQGRSKVLVTLQAQANKAVLEVSDRGAGIKPEDVSNVLRPFYRGDHARSDSTGAGLGLAIIDRLLRQTEGSLSINPRVGGGLTVSVLWPIDTSIVKNSTT
ncbi:HAMP domain-containing protein [Orrella sp. NBD-18]|uniref:histidine kinase n=1 Tax=Sheuella amnicola TaxID=2707330 RepID=A0A6B2QZV7_9BURK|nr:ATP-binding protein [Sheuella amnicola]NDY82699.1 HAMP domain-containing protein [Sheuella amnicola]HBI83899.1 two-component sensor histidine kinase [Alcaligenaceae bacterium]